MRHMRLVVAEGNTLFCAAEAMGLLNIVGIMIAAVIEIIEVTNVYFYYKFMPSYIGR